MTLHLPFTSSVHMGGGEANHRLSGLTETQVIKLNSLLSHMIRIGVSCRLSLENDGDSNTATFSLLNTEKHSVASVTFKEIIIRNGSDNPYGYLMGSGNEATPYLRAERAPILMPHRDMPHEIETALRDALMAKAREHGLHKVSTVGTVVQSLKNLEPKTA